MRIPSLDKYVRLLPPLGLLLAGTIIGSACFTAMYHHNFTLLAAKNAQLLADNGKLQRDIDDLRKNRSRQSRISQIDVKFEQAQGGAALDDITRSDIRKLAIKDLEPARGKAAADINDHLELYRALIDGSKYDFPGGRTYEVKVKAIIVSQGELTMWVTVEIPKRN